MVEMSLVENRLKVGLGQILTNLKLSANCGPESKPPSLTTPHTFLSSHSLSFSYFLSSPTTKP